MRKPCCPANRELKQGVPPRSHTALRLQRLVDLEAALREWRDAREAQGPQNDFRAEAEADERAARAEQRLLSLVPR